MSYNRQWRDYETASGHRPVKQFIEELTDEEAADLKAGMRDVRLEGLRAARHLRGEIYEVRVESGRRGFRILFATEGRYSQVLLAVEAFVKKTQQTPRRHIELAEKRLADWRSRGVRI